MRAARRLLILNRQKAVALDLAAAGAFARRLSRALRLGRREFNVCFVDDREIRRLNNLYRGRPRATDVLSFAWQETGEGEGNVGCGSEFRDFLGDVVISVPTARRNARAVGHPIFIEVCWLILHGVLHLLGYDHETDRGEMTALECSLREKLGIEGQSGRGKTSQRGTRQRARRGGKI